MFDVVVVGVDASETSKRAVEAASEIAKMSGRVLHIVTEYDPKTYDVKNSPAEFGSRNNESELDATLLATGAEVHPSLGAATLLAAEGVDVGVLDMSTLKPLDLAAVEEAATIGPIVTVEEHSVIGGLGGAVAEALCDLRSSAPLLRHGVHDEFVEIGPPAALHAHYRLDAAGVAGVSREFLDRLAR